MKFSAPAKPLADALAPIKAIAPSRSPVAILQHMRLEAGDGRLLATAYDLDKEAELVFALDVERPGATTVSAARLHEILRNMPKDARVTIEADDVSAKISAGRSRFTLPILPAIDFPRLAEEPFEHALDLVAPELRGALAAAAPAAANDSGRYWLEGVYLHVDAGKIAAVATDGNALVRIGLEQDAPPALAGVIIPSPTVKEFIRLCDAAGGGKVRLRLSRSRVRLEAGDFALTSKIVDGTFPDYHRVLPKGGEATVRFDRETALAALRRVAMAVDSDRPAILLQSSDGAIAMRGRDGAGAEAIDEIEAEIDGEFRVAFNHKYLLTALDALGGEMTVFEPGGEKGPTKFHDPARGDRALAVVMPLGWRD